MFTGLVEALGRVDRVDDEGSGRRLRLAWPGLSEARWPSARAWPSTAAA